MRARIVSVLLAFPVLGLAQSQNQIAGLEKAVLGQEVAEQRPAWLCGTPYFTEESARQALEHMRTADPAAYEAMLADWQQLRLAKTQADTIGTLKKFFVQNRVSNSFDTITARLMAKQALTQVWADTVELGNQHVTQTEIDALLKTLEETTPAGSQNPQKGIVEIENEYFGLPPNRDGDGITDFLLTDIKDGWSQGSNQGFIAGFFSPNDQLSTAMSNQRDILYMDTFPTIFFNGQRNVSFALSVAAHEFQHLIHYRYDTNELTFVNEGLSEMAMIVCGYLSENPLRYFSDTDKFLIGWNGEIADYARAGLFTLYYGQQFGLSILRAVVQDRENGITGINNALAGAGAAFDFVQLFENWAIANYLNDKTVDPKYAYDFALPGKPAEIHNFTDPNQTINGESIQGYAAEYIMYSFGDSLKITFSTPSSTLDIKAFKFSSGGGLVLDSVQNGVEYNAPEFGGSVRTIVFAIINKGSSSTTYSYTSQGVVTGVLAEEAYDDGTPDPFSGNAAFLSFGSNAAGYGWGVEFTPEVPNNKLVGARLLVVFDQEFGGSTTPANAPKDFLFHVWGDNNGLPGADLITPFIVSTDRTSTTGREFLDVDLSAYEAQLTNLGKIYIGFTEDDDDTVSTAVGLDNTTGQNHSFALFGPTHSTNPNEWFPLGNLAAGGVPLSGFNPMFRARFSYVDNSAPSFALGFLQHPIFSEQLDIFVVGNTGLNANTLSGTITHSGVQQNLVLKKVSVSDDRVFVDGSISLSNSGSVQIHVSGTTKFGQRTADTTATFNVQFLDSRIGGRITSSDGQLELSIPANAISQNGYVIAFTGNAEVLNQQVEAGLLGRRAKIFTLSPMGANLSVPATVTVNIDRLLFNGLAPEALELVQWDGSAWQPLAGTRVGGDALVAEIPRLGQIAIVEKNTPTAVEQPAKGIPSEYALRQNYPNPFNPETTISFDMPRAGSVRVTIFDLLGKEVRTLLDSPISAGRHTITWDGRDAFGLPVSSGVYIYAMRAGDFHKAMKLVLTR